MVRSDKAGLLPADARMYEAKRNRYAWRGRHFVAPDVRACCSGPDADASRWPGPRLGNLRGPRRASNRRAPRLTRFAGHLASRARRRSRAWDRDHRAGSARLRAERPRPRADGSRLGGRPSSPRRTPAAGPMSSYRRVAEAPTPPPLPGPTRTPSPTWGCSRPSAPSTCPACFEDATDPSLPCSASRASHR